MLMDYPLSFYKEEWVFKYTRILHSAGGHLQIFSHGSSEQGVGWRERGVGGGEDVVCEHKDPEQHQKSGPNRETG